MREKVLIGVFLACAALAAAEAEEQVPEKERELERGGWVVSGSVVPFSALDRHSIRSPAGRLSVYAPARSVYDLTLHQDTLWIATEGGLFAYSIADDSVASIRGPLPGPLHAIEFDDAGALWVGGRNGLSIRKRSSWSHYTPAVNRFFSRITDISLGDERVWLSSYGNGAGFVEDGRLRIYTRRDSLLDDRVLDVIEQEAHTVWFATASGLCMTDTLRWQSLRYGSKLPIGAVNDLLLDEEGNIFLAIENRGVAVYNLGRVRVFGPGRGLPERDVRTFSIDPFGKVWAAGRSGLGSFDGSGWIPYRLAGVPIERYNFLSMHHGLEGNGYLGTDEGIVLIVGRETVKEVIIPQMFTENRVGRLHAAEKAVWGIGVDHVYRFGDGWRRIDLPDEHFGGTLTDVASGRDDEIWVASRFGLLRFGGSSWEVFDRRQGLPTEHFTRVARDGSGHLWFGTYDKGILKLDGNTWVHYSTSTGLVDDRIEDMVVDRYGEPWIATASGSVARYHGKDWEDLPLPTGVRAVAASTHDSTGFFEPYIRFLPSEAGDDEAGSGAGNICLGLDGIGNCMVANGQGIYRFVDAQWQVIDLPESTRPVKCTAVLGTTRGQIWLGTEGQGIFIRSRTGWIRFGSVNGLPDEFIESLCEDAEGTIWIGTRFGGIATFVPGSSP